MKKLFFILLLLVPCHLSLVTVLFSAERQVTLTTYYPAPYGEYDELKSAQAWFGTVDGDLMPSDGRAILQVGNICQTGDAYTNSVPIAIFSHSDGIGFYAITDNDEAGISVGGIPIDHSAIHGRAQNSQNSNRVHGVLGTTRSYKDGASGIKGQTLVGQGVTYGVTGITYSSTQGAAGMYAEANNASGTTYGLHAVTNGRNNDAAAVFAEAKATIGGPSYGVQASTASSNTNSAGIYASAENGWAGYFSSDKGVAIANGDLYVGGTTSATSDGTVYAKNLPVMQYGFASYFAVPPNNLVGNIFQIFFPEPFDNPPIVVFSRNYFHSDDEMPMVHSVTEYSFKVHGDGVGIQATNPFDGKEYGINWIAIEQK